MYTVLSKWPGKLETSKTGKRRMTGTSADHSFGPDFPCLVINSKYPEKVTDTIINAETMFLAPGCPL